MSISIELIDEMRKRTNCSYQEAKELLEKHQGDIVEAIIEFEKKEGIKFNDSHCKHKSSYHEKGKMIWYKSTRTRFIIEKEGTIILNIPLLVLIIALLFTIPMFLIYLILFVALYFMGYKIRIKKDKGGDLNINEVVDEISNKVKNATEKTQEETKKSQDTGVKSEKKNEEQKYNEITVE